MKSRTIITLVIIVLVIFCIFVASGREVCNSIECNLKKDNITYIIDNQLYVLFRSDKRYESIRDIDNYDVLTYIFTIYEKDFDNRTYYSKNDVDNLFARSPFNNIMKVKHGNYDFYEYKDEMYTPDEVKPSERTSKYAVIASEKVVDFSKKKNVYDISVQYLFKNNEFVNDKGANVYGSINDLKYVNKKITSIDKEFNAQNYLNDNYDKIKGKLDTYHFKLRVFEDGTIELMKFSVN